MVAYNGVLDTLVAVAPKIRRNPAESGGFRRIVDHTYYVLDDVASPPLMLERLPPATSNSAVSRLDSPNFKHPHW